MEYSYISLMEPKTVNDVPESIYRITDDANGEFSSHAGKKVTVLNM